MPKKSQRSRNGRRSGPIVWAIDPFEDRTAHRAPLAKAVRALSRGLSARVIPFSVVSPAGLEWIVPTTAPLGGELSDFGRRAVSRDLKKLHLRGLAEPVVEIAERRTRRELVKDVIQFAEKKHAGLIAVNTRRLLSKFPFKVGGFAESLIGSSQVPVLAVSPKAKVGPRIRRILFATDFSRRSQSAYRKMLDLARELGAEVILFHVETPLEIPFTYTDVTIGVSDMVLEEARKTLRSRNRRASRRWLAEAEAAGARATYVEGPRTVSVAPAILRAARRHKADLISLAGYRGPHTPRALGGTIREVLSAARTPVLELHAA